MDQNAERPQSEARPARRRRAERKKETPPSSDFIYALASTEPGENGLPQLTKKLVDEPEAVLEAHLTREVLIAPIVGQVPVVPNKVIPDRGLASLSWPGLFLARSAACRFGHRWCRAGWDSGLYVLPVIALPNKGYLCTVLFKSEMHAPSRVGQHAVGGMVIYRYSTFILSHDSTALPQRS